MFYCYNTTDKKTNENITDKKSGTKSRQVNHLPCGAGSKEDDVKNLFQFEIIYHLPNKQKAWQ